MLTRVLTLALLACGACATGCHAARASQFVDGVTCSDAPRARASAVQRSSRAGSASSSVSIGLVNASAVRFTVEPTFLSLTFDADSLPLDWDGVDWTNPGLVSMAQALAPVILRFGGTEADWVTYAVDQQSDPTPEQIAAWNAAELAREPLATPRQPETLSFNQFGNFTQFVREVGWSLLWDLNALDRDAEGNWISDNDEKFIKLVAAHPELYPVVGFEFGNEPDIYSRAQIIVPGATLVKDIARLRTLLPPSAWLVGWDVATPYEQGLWGDMLEAYKDVPEDTIRASTLHHYYRHGELTPVEAAISPDALDELIAFIANATVIAAAHDFTRPLWLGESGSFAGGGVQGVSDRFGAGFMWLDKLGLAPLLGIGQLFRQTLRSSETSLPPMSYGLLSSNLLPNADFWSSVLYKRLMGQEVLELNLSQPGGGGAAVRTLRVYAHCTSRAASDSLPAGTVTPGAITLMVLNLSPSDPVALSFDGTLQPLLGPSRIEFRMSASQLGANWTETLSSIHVDLNGITLFNMCNGSLPHMGGLDVDSTAPLELEPLTYSFFVFPQAKVPACGYADDGEESKHGNAAARQQASHLVALE